MVTHMSFVLAAAAGGSIAFLLRFFVALRKEARIESSEPVSVSYLGQEQSQGPARVIVINQARAHRARASAIGNKAAM